MPSSRLDRSGYLGSIRIHGEGVEYLLKVADAKLQRNGMRFRTRVAFPIWRELTVELRLREGEPAQSCSSIVVSCSGDDYQGYAICLLFLNLSTVSGQRWAQIVDSRLA